MFKISIKLPIGSLLAGLLSLMLILFWTGCAHYPLNPQLTRDPAPTRVAADLPQFPQRSEELFLVVALSGGGTRAAALSYGVLEGLSQVVMPTTIGSESVLRRNGRTLLEEIEIISSVSGGSFTAAYYALHKDRLFEDFKDRFLYKNVQGQLIARLLSPYNLFRVMSMWYGRGDMAAEYYDKILFDGATFGDLQFRNAPLLFIQATDLVDGNCFGFTPYQFRLICSDLNEFPLARAVAASSAFPGAFDAIVMKNYAGDCDSTVDPQVIQAMQENPRTSRIFRAAYSSHTYLDVEEKPFIHLFDGGVCDNLGIRGPLNFAIVRGGVRGYLKSLGKLNTRRVAFIIVNAEGTSSSEWSRKGRLATIPRVMGSSGSVLLKSYTYETIELLRSYVREWTDDNHPGNTDMPLEFYVIEVTFDALTNEEERRFFTQIPTSLALSEETVDRLIKAGKAILYESEEFKRLLRDLGLSSANE